MNLYDHPDCPFGAKVRIVLAEGGLDFKMVTRDSVKVQTQPIYG